VSSVSLPSRAVLGLAQAHRIRRHASLTATSRTPPWLLSGWGCRGRRLSTLSALLLGKGSLQLRVLRLGFFQDGDVGIGVFPTNALLATQSGGQAHLLQEGGVARVVLYAFQQRVAFQRGEPAVALSVGPLQPLERLIGLPTGGFAHSSAVEINIVRT